MTATQPMPYHPDHDLQSATLREPFRVDVEPERDVVRVCPAGDVDLATVGEIRQRVDEVTAAGFGRVVIDLRAVTFLDSTGLHLLLELDASSSSDGWELGVIQGSAEVQRTFEVTGLRSVLPFIEVSELKNPRWRTCR